MAPLSRNIEDYPEGIIIPIDKPYRWTSADVIRKVKYTAIRHFGKKNLKVGHAGTLDPLATGVLLVCIGKATKLAEELQSHDKEYVAGITFGATTPSYDLEKEIDRFFPHEHITAAGVAEALPAFLGEQDQVAPLFSAKSVDGVRAYELARKLHAQGKTLDEAAAELIRVARINITELELMEYIGSGVASEDPRPVPSALTHPLAGGGEMSSPAITVTANPGASSRINVTDNSELGLPRAVVRMACSKGTYVRAFARDLGEALGSGAHLDSLQRSRSGIFRVENALTVEQAVGMFAV
jgi:tRNA pseudouridine55 synthase